MLRAATVLIIAFVAIQVSGHGSLYKPVSRNSAWRFGFNTPPDYDDNQLYCGGMGIQWNQNGGKCGICGDPYQEPVPRKHENGGTWGTRTIVETYKAGQVIDVLVHLSASHLGDFTFSVCSLDGGKKETEECFQPLKLADGSDKWNNIPAPQDYNIKVKLPDNLTCEQCSFRWHYRTGNTYGDCGDGTQATGCGPQETFRNCADIKITN